MWFLLLTMLSVPQPKPTVCILYDTVKAKPIVILLAKDETGCDHMHDNAPNADGSAAPFVAQLRLPMSMFKGDPDEWNDALGISAQAQAMFDDLERAQP